MTKLIGVVAGMWLALAGARAAHAQDGRDAITPLGVDATSTLRDKHHAYDAWHALDGSMTTAWCEGAKSDGVGEALTITGHSLSFTRLEIAAGFWKTEKLFAANNQPTRLTITVTSHDGDETTSEVSVASGMDATVFEPGGSVDAMSIRIEFSSVSKQKLSDTCISNVSIYDGAEARVPYFDTAASIDDLMTAIFALEDAFASCDAAALKTNTSFPLTIGKKKLKKLKDLAKWCTPAALTLGDPDFHGLTTEGPGKVAYGPGQDRWHFRYEPDPEGFGGTWRLTKVETD
jgi:hypothetical protein